MPPLKPCDGGGATPKAQPTTAAVALKTSPTPAMTAEGMFVQQLLGAPLGDQRMQRSAIAISSQTPKWESANLLRANVRYTHTCKDGFKIGKELFRIEK